MESLRDGVGSDIKESACIAGDLGSILGSGWSPGEGNSYSLWYSCLENPMERKAWGATVHGVPKSLTWLRDSYFLKRNSFLSKVHRGFLYFVVKIFKFCILHLIQPFIWHLFLCVGYKKKNKYHFAHTSNQMSKNYLFPQWLVMSPLFVIRFLLVWA